MRPRSLRTTFSHSSGFSPGRSGRRVSSAKPAALTVRLWQPAQYLLRVACSAGTGEPDPEADCASSGWPARKAAVARKERAKPPTDQTSQRRVMQPPRFLSGHRKRPAHTNTAAGRRAVPAPGVVSPHSAKPRSVPAGWQALSAAVGGGSHAAKTMAYSALFTLAQAPPARADSGTSTPV